MFDSWGLWGLHEMTHIDFLTLRSGFQTLVSNSVTWVFTTKQHLGALPEDVCVSDSGEHLSACTLNILPAGADAGSAGATFEDHGIEQTLNVWIFLLLFLVFTAFILWNLSNTASSFGPKGNLYPVSLHNSQSNLTFLYLVLITMAFT